jgi:hypothetical protein
MILAFFFFSLKKYSVTNMQEGFVRSEIKEGIGYITFFHPQSNSMPGYQLRAVTTHRQK